MSQKLTPESNQLEVVGRIAHLIRSVADKDPGVGHDLMLSALPIAVASRLQDFHISDGRPNPTSATFLYMPQSGADVLFAPTVVMAGQVISGFQLLKTPGGRVITGRVGNFNIKSNQSDVVGD
jgi:hypothetical protein